MSVKLAHKVLCSTTAERAARVDVADKHPLVVDLHQVWALPHTTMITILFAKRTFVCPFGQILR